MESRESEVQGRLLPHSKVEASLGCKIQSQTENKKLIKEKEALPFTRETVPWQQGPFSAPLLWLSLVSAGAALWGPSDLTAWLQARLRPLSYDLSLAMRQPDRCVIQT